MDEADDLNELVQRMSKRQYEQSPGLYDALPERAKRLMKRDFFYGISYLKSAIDLKQEQIFVSYVRWTYEYLTYLMVYVSKEQMTRQCLDFYAAMAACLQDELPPQEYAFAQRCIQQGNREIERLFKVGFSRPEAIEEQGTKSTPDNLAAEYIALVLRRDSKAAMQYFLKLQQGGMTLEEIYLGVVQKVMYTIGELWFEKKISVAQEHYCTALTQTAIAQLYSTIFSTPPNGHTMIGCCIGGELHELGMRMITDLFTYEGWNSLFLGAGVPEEALLDAVKEQKPELIALSVTMPQQLLLCKNTIRQLRSKAPGV